MRTDNFAAKNVSVCEFAFTSGLCRLFSLRHDFPNAFHQLLNPSDNVQAADLEITKQHFPYFLADMELTISGVTVYLKPVGKDAVETAGLNLKVNDTNINGGWSILDKTNLQEGNVLLSGSPVMKWTIDAGTGGLDKKELEDIFILVKYTVS